MREVRRMRGEKSGVGGVVSEVLYVLQDAHQCRCRDCR